MAEEEVGVEGEGEEEVGEGVDMAIKVATEIIKVVMEIIKVVMEIIKVGMGITRVVVDMEITKVWILNTKFCSFNIFVWLRLSLCVNGLGFHLFL